MSFLSLFHPFTPVATMPTIGLLPHFIFSPDRNHFPIGPTNVLTNLTDSYVSS
jgi:hypothetical protein